jgi:hypothetical protein
MKNRPGLFRQADTSGIGRFGKANTNPWSGMENPLSAVF